MDVNFLRSKRKKSYTFIVVRFLFSFFVHNEQIDGLIISTTDVYKFILMI